MPVYIFIAQSSLHNRHTHISANGIVISHSHPVNHADHEPINAHDHSGSEICFYHLVQFDYFSPSPEIQIIIQEYSTWENFYVADDKSKQQLLLHRNFKRGPPQSSNS